MINLSLNAAILIYFVQITFDVEISLVTLPFIFMMSCVAAYVVTELKRNSLDQIRTYLEIRTHRDEFEKILFSMPEGVTIARPRTKREQYDDLQEIDKHFQD